MLASASAPDTNDRRSKRRKVEMLLFGLESDHARLEREETALGTHLLGLRQSLHQLEAQIRTVEAKLEQVQGKMLALEGEIQNAKKSMRLL